MSSLPLLAQGGDTIDLAQEWRRAHAGGTRTNLVIIKLVDIGGRPVRGKIGCEGYWWKYADEGRKTWDWHLMFDTDSRGAAGFNPDPELTPDMVCTGVSGFRKGTIKFSGEVPRATREIVVR